MNFEKGSSWIRSQLAMRLDQSVSFEVVSDSGLRRAGFFVLLRLQVTFAILTRRLRSLPLHRPDSHPPTCKVLLEQ